jgi:hypothetical protein
VIGTLFVGYFPSVFLPGVLSLVNIWSLFFSNYTLSPALDWVGGGLGSIDEGGYDGCIIRMGFD